MSSVAIVTFSTLLKGSHPYRYVLGEERLRQSLINVGFAGSYFSFKDYKSIDSPSHSEIPYAFKPYAIKKVKDLGYDIVIWIDSAVYPTKKFDHFVKHIEENGHAFFDNIGFAIRDHTSDKCLEYFNMTDEESWKHPMIMACLMGFNFNNETTCKIFKEYYEAANEQAYGGDWINNDLQVSTNPKVKGHRHDQSVMSIILAKKGIKPIHPNSTFFAYYGNPGHEPHAETVCFLSQGF